MPPCTLWVLAACPSLLHLCVQVQKYIPNERSGHWMAGAGGAAQGELTVIPSITTQTLGGQEFNFFVIRIHMEAEWDGILCEQCAVHYIPECLLCI